MRIADKMQFEQVKANVGKNRAELSQLQNQAATQKRVTKPSDDPLAATRVLANRTELQGADQFIKNINSAKGYLDYADQSLGDLIDSLVRAKELALSQANDASANETSRRVVATEIEQLFEQAVQIGNRKLGDRFLFGGYRTTAPPFDANGEYHGDTGEIMIQINKDAFVAMNVPGSQVFQGDGVSRDGIVKTNSVTPTTVEELEKQRSAEAEPLPMRGPASIDESAPPAEVSGTSSSWNTAGRNVFTLLKDLEIGLRTDHKASVQNSIDQIDEALAQVILARSQVGSRIMALDNNLNTLQKGTVDSKTTISQLEDADTFTLVSDISKNQNTLQATLATSGKLIQPSLLDFLK